MSAFRFPFAAALLVATALSRESAAQVMFSGTVRSAAGAVAGAEVRATEGKFSIQLPQPSSGSIGGRPNSALSIRVTASGLLPESVETDLSGIGGAVFPPVEIFSLTTDREHRVAGSSGTFEGSVVPDLYAVQAFVRGAAFMYGRTIVDARGGDVTNVELPLAGGDDAFHRSL